MEFTLKRLFFGWAKIQVLLLFFCDNGFYAHK